jgi:hypothetical protein
MTLGKWMADLSAKHSELVSHCVNRQRSPPARANHKRSLSSNDKHIRDEMRDRWLVGLHRPRSVPSRHLSLLFYCGG